MKQLLLSLPIAIVAIGCTVKKPEAQNATSLKVEEDNNQSVNFNYMDQSVDPKTDFYEYANGTWSKNNPVPSSETKWGSFNELQIDNYDKIKIILESTAKQKNEKGSVEQLIGDYYHTFMDDEARMKEGYSSIKKYLDQIDAVKGSNDLPVLMADLHNMGFGGLFEIGVEQDLKNNTRNTIYFGQGGIGLPSKGYYTKTDEASALLQEEYRTFMGHLLKVIGDDNPPIDKIYGIEKRLAEASMSRVEMRNYVAQYNPMSILELNELTTKGKQSFDWLLYLSKRGITKIDTVIVAQKDFYANLPVILNLPISDIKAYLKWAVTRSAAGFLSPKFQEVAFDFYGKKLSGQKERKPAWKRAIDNISSSGISEALGHVFVNKHFTNSSKQKVNEMVDNIIAVYKDRINNLAWMSEETKIQAQTKLASFTRKLGYPEKWTDYSKLKIDRNSYAMNVMRVRAFAIKKNLDKLHKPIDKTEWAMAPHIVNAYYNPLFNEIVFPAGIMQPPFFDPSKEDAVNYASMGAVIGHELTHGFDDQGSQFNSEGEFKNWWTEKDQLQFAARTEKLVNQFNNFEALPGLKINGQLTLGENIADLGGLTIAYHAYQKSMTGKERTTINGLTNEQRFFVAFAQVWKSNYTEDAMKMQIATNNHSPGKWRVLGPLSNMPEFFQAFDVKEGDAMRQPKEKISAIW